MQSLNRHVVQQRIALVIDTAVGSNADSKGLKRHLKDLRQAVGLEVPVVDGATAFKSRFGGAKREKR
jgi:hypothetical protein